MAEFNSKSQMIKIDHKKINSFCNNMRKSIIYAAMCAGTSSAHIGGALSSVEIIGVLFSSIMKTNYKDPVNLNRDRFILSKGHAAPALFQVLAMRGFYPESNLEHCGKDGIVFGEHPPSPRYLAGIEAATGSLGHGMSIGLGMALAARFNNLNYSVFVILGDGECNEGSVWESAMFASA